MTGIPADYADIMLPAPGSSVLSFCSFPLPSISQRPLFTGNTEPFSTRLTSVSAANAGLFSTYEVPPKKELEYLTVRAATAQKTDPGIISLLYPTKHTSLAIPLWILAFWEIAKKLRAVQ